MLRCRTSLRPLRCAPIQTIARSHISTKGLVAELEYRGLIADLTASQDNLANFLDQRRVVYCGVDPTAASLHVGNLLPLLTLLHFQIRGHQPIAVLGGATGLIGDPSGRDEERSIQAEEKIQGNAVRINLQLSRLFEGALLYAQKRVQLPKSRKALIVVNNLSWWRDLNLVDFLHSTGKFAKISSMLSRESVRSRMATSSGISFAEFSYQLLQAHDFWHLYNYHGCSVQIGGSDQWGNILAGLDLIGRREDKSDKPSDAKQAIGITTPLLTTSSGQKFGKSAGNAVWLNPQKTSVFDFYQFFLRTSDADVEKYLKLFTLLGPEEIAVVMRTHESQPESRSAQRTLACEVTELIHGEAGVARAQAATRLLFDTDLTNIRPEDAVEALRYDPRYHTVPETELLGMPLTKLAVSSGLTKTRAEAVRLVESRGLYLNNISVNKPEQRLQAQDLICDRLVILRAGKDKHAVLSLL